MKLQESNARAQVQQQKVVNMLDITAAATFRSGNLTHIFIPQAAISHSTHYSFYTVRGHNLLLCAEILDRQSVSKFQSVTALRVWMAKPSNSPPPKTQGHHTDSQGQGEGSWESQGRPSRRNRHHRTEE